MSILIKGMEMPTSCGVCRFMYQECGEWHEKEVIVYMCACCSQGTAEPEYNNTRASYCPLVPVPPHGDLIDADALDIKRREEQAWNDYEKNPDNEYLEGVKDGLHEAAKRLSIAPTIIPKSGGTEDE